jgi:hypothetical protein
MVCYGGKSGWAYDRDGTTPEQCLRTWCRLLGLSTEGGKWQLCGRLRKYLASEDRRFLIVIDDVWEPWNLRPLMVDGPQSRVLITGRELQVLDQAGVLAERITVPIMTEGECLAVVEKHVGSLAQDKPKATEFLERVGHLPMAVEIGAGLARDRGWDWLLDGTRERIAPVLQRGRRSGRDDSLSVALALSYGRLGKAERMVLNLLSTWPQERPFRARDLEVSCPSPVLHEIARCGMDVSTLLHNLHERSLLQRVGGAAYRLHTLFSM